MYPPAKQHKKKKREKEGKPKEKKVCVTVHNLL
jgi:hypothetical protein